MTRSPASLRAGFSLVEVLVAVALVTALVAAMFGFLRNVIDSRQRVLERTATQRAASVLIDRLEADLAACLVGDAAFGSGLSGDETSISVLTRGLGLSLVDRGEGEAAVLGDLQRAEYRFDGERRVIEARRIEAKAPAAEPTSAELLGGTIYKLRFRYHDGSSWRDSFDALKADRLPAAVEVAMWFHPWPEDQSGNVESGNGESGNRESDSGDLEADAFRSPRSVTADGRRSWRDALDEPTPDRIRVIVIPDSGANDARTVAKADEGGSP